MCLFLQEPDFSKSKHLAMTSLMKTIHLPKSASIKNRAVGKEEAAFSFVKGTSTIISGNALVLMV
jgi:hypothetical protein